MQAKGGENKIYSCKFLPRRKGYTLSQKILFLKQLHLILASGVSILKGISILERRVDKATVNVCKRLLLDLQNGRTLAQAMRKNPEFFSELISTLTEAGERSGELQNVLESLVLYYSRHKELQSFFVKSLIYPLFLLLAGLCVLLFFLLYVLPILATAYTAMQAKPNALMNCILQISNFLKNYYVPVLALILTLGYAFYKSLPSITKLILKIAWCKTSYNLFLEARFCKLLAILLSSGINITDAVSIAGNTITAPHMLAKLQLWKVYLQKGMEISMAIDRSLELFSPLTKELLTVGAVTGYLPQMLDEAGKIAEEDLRERLAKVRELLAPTLLLIVAVLTAGIICTVMAPMFDLFTAIPDY